MWAFGGPGACSASLRWLMLGTGVLDRPGPTTHCSFDLPHSRPRFPPVTSRRRLIWLEVDRRGLGGGLFAEDRWSSGGASAAHPHSRHSARRRTASPSTHFLRSAVSHFTEPARRRRYGLETGIWRLSSRQDIRRPALPDHRGKGTEWYHVC